MRLALGLSVHTGWAAAAVAGGDWANPVVVLRERLVLLGEESRFVFHRAAEMTSDDAGRWVAQARKEALARAVFAMKRLAATHAVKACAVAAKMGASLPLEEVVAAHPRIHTAEGCFYRDVLVEAAEAAGMRAKVIAPKELCATDPRLANVGKVVGRPWSVNWKVAVLCAWRVGSV
jgi:hypothetical protein